MVHYKVGQQYRKHWDAFDRTTERGALLMQATGNRLLTALMYLSVPDSGGVCTTTTPC